MISNKKISNNNKDVLMLIDGNALIHRSYHGIPPLKTKSGVLVNAVYGFTNSIFSAIAEFGPRYLAVAFDISKATKRIEKYKQYKAHRVKMDDELYEQIPLVRKVCDVLNYPKIGIKGYEADDVIGTIAEKIRNSKSETRNKKIQTIIVTGDMDTLQLVNKNTFVYSVSRGIRRAELFDQDAVKEKYGFTSEYLVDYKGLRGDPSDNIPGVPGVGDKTAKDLVIKYGHIEDIYKNLDKLKSRTKTLLEQGKDKAFLSRDLATIDKNTPLDFDLRNAKVSDYDKEKVVRFFNELDFKSLIKKLPEAKEQVKQKSLF